MNKEYILDSLTEMIPNPKCELNYNSDYTLLIAILLSAQTLDKNVNKITPILFSKYPTLEDLKNAKWLIRSELAKRLTIRKTPDLNFVLDDSYQKGEHIEEIIKEIKRKESSKE